MPIYNGRKQQPSTGHRQAWHWSLLSLPHLISPPLPYLAPFLVLCLVTDSFAYVSCFITHHSCFVLAPGECCLCLSGNSKDLPWSSLSS